MLFDNKLVLRALQCLQYQTDQIAELKKVEKLNDRFFALMARGADAMGTAQHLALMLSACSPFEWSCCDSYVGLQTWR